MPGVSQGRTDLLGQFYVTCYRVCSRICYLTHSQYTDIRPTSPSTAATTPGALQGSLMSAEFEVSSMTQSGKRGPISGSPALKVDAFPTGAASCIVAVNNTISQSEFTAHGKALSCQVLIKANNVYLNTERASGPAAGMERQLRLNSYSNHECVCV